MLTIFITIFQYFLALEETPPSRVWCFWTNFLSFQRLFLSSSVLFDLYIWIKGGFQNIFCVFLKIVGKHLIVHIWYDQVKSLYHLIERSDGLLLNPITVVVPSLKVFLAQRFRSQPLSQLSQLCPDVDFPLSDIFL